MYKLILLLFVYNLSFAQTADSKADSLRQTGNLEAAIVAYKAKHTSIKSNWKNTYDLACSYALTYQKDSAFHYLNIALKDDNSLWALADSDLFALIDDERWTSIENNRIEQYQKHNQPLKQPEYAKKLLKLIMKDQALDYYVHQARSSFMKEGSIPHWYYPIGAFKQEITKENYSNMQQLIKTYGWPKYSTVGELAADAPLLVINHHESDDIRKEYLEQIKQSCLNKEGSCMEYAKIQDRILVNEDQLQVYGMQFRYNSERKLEPFPIKDPEYVDQRRTAIGLEPLKDYLKRKIDYDWTVKQKK